MKIKWRLHKNLIFSVVNWGWKIWESVMEKWINPIFCVNWKKFLKNCEKVKREINVEGCKIEKPLLEDNLLLYSYKMKSCVKNCI